MCKGPVVEEDNFERRPLRRSKGEHEPGGRMALLAMESSSLFPGIIGSPEGL